MLMKIIGREREQRLIEEYIQSEKPELIAVYGRRRVGKTYLIRKFFDDKFDFYFTGSFETPRRIQLDLFQKSLQRYSGKKLKQPKTGLRLSGNFRITCLLSIKTVL